MERLKWCTDDDLAAAVSNSSSWRSVLRELGKSSSSSSASRAARLRADTLGLDYSHFLSHHARNNYGRPRAGLNSACSWEKAAKSPNLGSSTKKSTLKTHAVRPGINCSHLGAQVNCSDDPVALPHLSRLSRSGPLLAASWFTLTGWDVSWPLEPCRYDLIVIQGKMARRVQVKTTITRAGRTWKAYLSTTSGGRRPYFPDEVDDFFVIDGDLNLYLLPFQVVGGLLAVHLSAYEAHRVGRLSWESGAIRG